MARLPERVFQGYMRHAEEHMLPFRRFEFALARIAQYLDHGKPKPLREYLFDAPAEEDEPEFQDDAEAAAATLGLPLIRKPKPMNNEGAL